MKRKYLMVVSLVLAITMAFSTMSFAATSTATTKGKALSPVNLNLYFIGTNAQQDDDAVATEMTKQIKDRVNAKVKLNFFDWGAFDTRTNLLLASGEPMDILFQASWLGASYANNVSKGYLLPLDNLLSKYAPEAKKVIPEFLFRGIAIKGKVYGMPTYKEIGSQKGFVIVKKWADKYKINLKKINKWSDLEPILKMIKEKEPQLTPYMGKVYNDSKASNPIYQLFGSNDLPLANTFDNTKVVLLPEQKWYVDNCKLAYEWVQKGYFPKDILTFTDPKSVMIAGKGFIQEVGLKPGKDKELSKEYGVDLVQKEMGPVYVGNDEGSGSIMSVGKSSKNPERAVMLMNLLYTDKKLINTLAFGVEGLDYVRKGANFINYPAGVNADKVGYNHGFAWQFGNQYLNYLWIGENPNKWKQFKSYSKRAVSPKIMGFSFDQANVKTQIANIVNVTKQYAPAIEKGAMEDVDGYIKTYIQALKAAGIDQVKTDMQKQVDAFLKSSKK